MKIAIYHNLPGGGGIRMLKSIIDRYKNTCDIDLFVIGENKPKSINGVKTFFTKVDPWRGFFPYNLWINLVLPHIHNKVASRINWDKYDFILFNHDYYTKSPYLIRYVNNKNKYYLCQESQREYYEDFRYHINSFKDLIALFFRYPIKLVDQQNVKHASKLFCNSMYSKKTLSKIYKREFEVVYPGVDESYFVPDNTNKEKMILCVGGINKTKNQEFLAISLLPILDHYQLVLVGSGKGQYIQRIANISKNIKIESNVTDKELKLMYQKSMLTCVTAYREPFGLSSIESQSCGTPVLTISGGGTEETVINGKTGMISKLDKNEFLSKAKIILKNNKKMGQHARKNVLTNWTLDKTLSAMDKYFIV